MEEGHRIRQKGEDKRRSGDGKRLYIPMSGLRKRTIMHFPVPKIQSSARVETSKRGQQD